MALETYPLTPNRISNGTEEFDTTIIKFESGAEQRCANRSTSKPSFTLRHQMIPVSSDLATLITFFKARRGSYGMFNFNNHIDGVTYPCRFASDKLAIEYINTRFANVDLEIIQC